jgi:hypothetical protein
VGELVDQDHLWTASEDGVGVHLGEGGAAVLHVLARHHLQVTDHRLGVLAAVAFHETDDNVGASGLAPVRLLEHGEGLTDARGGPEIDP